MIVLQEFARNKCSYFRLEANKWSWIYCNNKRI